MVAIIGILVTIRIPIFAAQRKKGMRAVDMANLRSAKAAAAAEYLTDGATGKKTYYYDAASGTVKDSGVTDISSITGYEKSDNAMTEANNTVPCEKGTPEVAAVTFDGDNTLVAEWKTGTSTGSYYQDVLKLADTLS